MTKHISKEEFAKWYYLLRTESEKKLHKVSLNELFSEIKPKHLKYILTPRFLKKIIFDWKEAIRYAKQTKIK